MVGRRDPRPRREPSPGSRARGGRVHPSLRPGSRLCSWASAHAASPVEYREVSPGTGAAARRSYVLSICPPVVIWPTRNRPKRPQLVVVACRRPWRRGAGRARRPSTRSRRDGPTLSFSTNAMPSPAGTRLSSITASAGVGRVEHLRMAGPGKLVQRHRHAGVAHDVVPGRDHGRCHGRTRRRSDRRRPDPARSTPQRRRRTPRSRRGAHPGSPPVPGR